MTMGERLRQAREEAGLSQRQVCGDQITRNQLSQLEHDRVGPSVETLRYLARQLGKPVSYFLGEISPNLQILQEVRTTQDPEQALHRLAGYRPDGSVADDLVVLLEALLCLAASDQAAAEGRVPYARRLVAQGHEALKRCVFPGEDLKQGLRLREAELAEEPDFLPAAEAWARSREPGPDGSTQLGPGLPGTSPGALRGSARPAPPPGTGTLPPGPVSRGLGAFAPGRGADDARAGATALAFAGSVLPGVRDYRGAYEYAAKLRPPGEP